METVRRLSAHDFLYGDRHKKFYPFIDIYLGGSMERLIPFLALLEQGKDAQEICEALKLVHRGDVWFATLIVHFHIRDGLVEIPRLSSVEVPPELADKYAIYDEIWQRRNDPPESNVIPFESGRNG